MKVENMTSHNGNPVPNQFIIIDNDGTEFFQSYKTIIARKDGKTGEITLNRKFWDYSKTTGKYRNQFTGMNKAETVKAINDGTIKLIDM